MKPIVFTKTFNTGAISPATLLPSVLVAAGEPEFAATKTFILWGVKLQCESYTSGAQLSVRLQTSAGVDLVVGRTSSTVGSSFVAKFPAGVVSNNGLQIVLGGGSTTGSVTLVYTPGSPIQNDLNDSYILPEPEE